MNAVWGARHVPGCCAAGHRPAPGCGAAALLGAAALGLLAQPATAQEAPRGKQAGDFVIGLSVIGVLPMDSGSVDLIACAANQILKYDGSAWACSADADSTGSGVTSLNSQTGALTLNNATAAAGSDAALEAAEAAVNAMRAVRGVIMPFPGGIVRAGSKVGAKKYKNMSASTNDAYCPTLRGRDGVTSLLPEGANSVLEIVVDGRTPIDEWLEGLPALIRAAMA